MPKVFKFLIPALLIFVTASYFLLQNREVGNFVEKTKFQVREAVQPIIKPAPTLPPSPTQKVLTGGYQTFQTFNNCGPASLSMLLRYFGINVSQHELGEALRPYQQARGDNDDKSTTLNEMEKKAQEYEFITYYRPNGNIEIIKRFISSGIPVIARTWLKSDDAIGHYRVVKGYDDAKQVIIQDDSYQGANKEYSYDEFNNLWEAFNFEYMVIVKPEQKEITEAIIGDDVNEVVAWENSIKVSDATLSKNNSDVYARFNKSVALYHLGKFEEATKLFEKVEGELPFRMLWYQIEPILAYQKLGKFDRVFGITDHLINGGNRAFSEAYQIRGEIYEAQGKTTEAKAEFEKVLLYNKNFYKYWD